MPVKETLYNVVTCDDVDRLVAAGQIALLGKMVGDTAVGTVMFEDEALENALQMLNEFESQKVAS
jgi:3-phosphoglycerate kinase